MNKDKLKYYLKLLKLKDDSSLSEIKTAYRNAAKIHHPDKSNSQHATETFNEIKTAQEVLVSLRIESPKGSLTILNDKDEVRIKRKPNLQKEKITYLDIIGSRKFWALTLTLINVFLLGKIGFNSFLTPIQLTGTILSFCLFSILFYKTINKYKIHFIGYFALPFLAANIFLSVNFIFSSNPYLERHLIKQEVIKTTISTVTKRSESTLIQLNNDAHEKYPGLRLHFDLDPLLRAIGVEFKIETGLFGIKVLKNSTPIF
ncbi:MAG: hypothetical protein ACJAZ2_000109 [Glaciecola sp.]|jgi:hypothetical protein